MEGYCSTDQNPQRAVVPMEEEEDIYIYMCVCVCVCTCFFDALSSIIVRSVVMDSWISYYGRVIV